MSPENSDSDFDVEAERKEACKVFTQKRVAALLLVALAFTPGVATVVLSAIAKHHQVASPEDIIQTQEGQPCLCLFDVDRTLTGKQGAADQCYGNQVMQGIFDNAFATGDLVLSQLALGYQGTFCATQACQVGIVSMGTASGPEEKDALMQQLMPGVQAPEWSTYPNINSPLVTSCPDAEKANCAEQIVAWYANQQINIPPSNVYFFDDHDGNTNGFAEKGYNARQISCATREGAIGLCGATLNEIVQEPGVWNC